MSVGASLPIQLRGSQDYMQCIMALHTDIVEAQDRASRVWADSKSSSRDIGPMETCCDKLASRVCWLAGEYADDSEAMEGVDRTIVESGIRKLQKSVRDLVNGIRWWSDPAIVCDSDMCDLEHDTIANRMMKARREIIVANNDVSQVCANFDASSREFLSIQTRCLELEGRMVTILSDCILSDCHMDERDPTVPTTDARKLQMSMDDLTDRVRAVSSESVAGNRIQVLAYDAIARQDLSPSVLKPGVPKGKSSRELYREIKDLIETREKTCSMAFLYHAYMQQSKVRTYLNVHRDHKTATEELQDWERQHYAAKESLLRARKEIQEMREKTAKMQWINERLMQIREQELALSCAESCPSLQEHMASLSKQYSEIKAQGVEISRALKSVSEEALSISEEKLEAEYEETRVKLLDKQARLAAVLQDILAEQEGSRERIEALKLSLAQ